MDDSQPSPHSTDGMGKLAPGLQPSSTQAPLQRYQSCKAMARGYADSKKVEKTRLAHARAFCHAVIQAYWLAVAARQGTKIKAKAVAMELPTLPDEALEVADSAGRLIAGFPVEDAGYLIGSIYTVMLPATLRSDMGAYYTPPPLVARLLDLAESAGFDFAKGSVIDPACGGGAFLAPVALRMLAKAGTDASPEWTLRRLGKRLKGIEIDPFAAWMTSVLLEAAVMPLCVAAKRRLADVVTVADALKPHDHGRYDLVIGNPPYGRLTLPAPLREHYARSLYGHANLYGLFTDLALRLAKSDGVIAYLTPTSFLGGQYFKALRELLIQEVTPVAFDFVADREGVFDDVLQETLLTAYTRQPRTARATVSLVVPCGLNEARIELVGEVSMALTGAPWLLPRTAADAAFLRRMANMPTRLADLGYGISTGPLVWNRHKPQLSTAPADALPLIWAESVISEGFVFSANRRGHVPYIRVRLNQPHLITRESAVLVQRTTSKEQNRRLLAALLPQSFLDTHGGAVVENHLNMVQPTALDLAVVRPETIAALLNTAAVDRAFRCISGSVAVSAYELNALPLPAPEQLKELERLIRRGAVKATIEKKVAAFYEGV